VYWPIKLEEKSNGNRYLFGLPVPFILMFAPAWDWIVAAITHPQDRAKSIGVFRLWRDLGYAIGAILTGNIADVLGIEASIFTIAGLTLISALVIAVRMEVKIAK